MEKGHPKPQPSAVPTGREVLVVEDEIRIRNMLSQALKQMGFEATVAASAEAATRVFQQRPFDILILDLNLPGMGGMDFLERARAQHRDVQVIILTGFGDLAAAQKAIDLDVAAFLTKPCTLGSLEVALTKAWNRRRGQIVGGSEVRLQFETEPEVSPALPVVEVSQGGEKPLQSMEEIEQRHILEVLRKHHGNRAATAAELGISLRKLYYRLGEYHKKGLAIR